MTDPGSVNLGAPGTAGHHIEQALLAGLQRHPDALGALAGWLRPEHFADPAHAELYRVLTDLVERGRMSGTVRDLVQVRAALPFAVDLVQLHNIGAHVRPERLPRYGKMVLETAFRRDVERWALRFEQVASRVTDNPETVADTITAMTGALREGLPPEQRSGISSDGAGSPTAAVTEPPPPEPLPPTLVERSEQRLLHAVIADPDTYEHLITGLQPEHFRPLGRASTDLAGRAGPAPRPRSHRPVDRGVAVRHPGQHVAAQSASRHER
jgi:hypothetical protein